MTDKHSWHFATQAIHVGTEISPQDVSPPIHMANTYLFESATEAAHAFEAQDRPIYTRWGNPTLAVMERKVAALENAEAAIAAASGMAAVSATLLAAVEAGDHVVATTGLYSGSHNLLTKDLMRYGVETSIAEATDPQAFEAAIRPNTRAIYLESPGNPTLSLNDIQAIAEIARTHGLLTLVDNTFATPFNQRPLDLGADAVLHSATKFLGGHGDAIGGVIAGSADLIDRVKGPIRQYGGCLSPFNAWLIARGINTLPLRMKRHNDNALTIAQWLESRQGVRWVRYPWLASHPQVTLAKAQMPGGGGGVVVFELKGGIEAGRRLLNRVHLCARTVSLGDVRTLITHPASTTHHSVDPETRRRSGITDGLVRLAVGLEDSEDIVADLDRALSS